MKSSWITAAGALAASAPALHQHTLSSFDPAVVNTWWTNKDAPNLEEYRAHLRSIGKQDPLEHMSAAERQYYCDTHRNYNPLWQDPLGYDYGPHKTMYGRGSGNAGLLASAGGFTGRWLVFIDNPTLPRRTLRGLVRLSIAGPLLYWLIWGKERERAAWLKQKYVEGQDPPAIGWLGNKYPPWPFVLNRRGLVANYWYC